MVITFVEMGLGVLGVIDMIDQIKYITPMTPRSISTYLLAYPIFHLTKIALSIVCYGVHIYFTAES